MSLSTLSAELHPAMSFFDIANKIAERARNRGQVGEGGGFVWTIAEWQRFCRAAREEKHLAFLGNAVFRTVSEVEALIAQGKTAREIHAALYWRSRTDDTEHEKRLRTEQAEAERAAGAARQREVQAEYEREKIRVEARRRARDEQSESDSRRVAV